MIKLIHSVGDADSLGLSAGFVGKAVDTETKRVVGYLQSDTFDGDSVSTLDVDMNCYQFVSPWKFSAYGTSLRAVFIRLGLGHRYEEEWGDYAELLALLRINPDELHITRVSHSLVEKSEVRAIVKGILGG